MKKHRMTATAFCLAMSLSVSGIAAMAGETDAAEGGEAAAEETDHADSWRYEDGQLMESTSVTAFSAVTPATTYTTWPEVAGAQAYGIDVSRYQGTIDWEAAQADGVEFAIIRCGYGQDYESQDDPYWEINADACTELGIPFGTYLYSYADTVEKAISEAEHVLRLVEGYDLSYPVYYDLEDDSLSGLSASELAAIAEAFCSTIEEAGYEAGVYARLTWFNSKLTDDVFDQYEKWVAQWNTSCTYDGEYTMWQCSSSGQVDGIIGPVDLNIDFGAAISSDGTGDASADTGSEEGEGTADETGEGSVSGDTDTDAGGVTDAEDPADTGGTEGSGETAGTDDGAAADDVNGGAGADAEDPADAEVTEGSGETAGADDGAAAGDVSGGAGADAEDPADGVEAEGAENAKDPENAVDETDDGSVTDEGEAGDDISGADDREDAAGDDGDITEIAGTIGGGADDSSPSGSAESSSTDTSDTESSSSASPGTSSGTSAASSAASSGSSMDDDSGKYADETISTSNPETGDAGRTGMLAAAAAAAGVVVVLLAAGRVKTRRGR